MAHARALKKNTRVAYSHVKQAVKGSENLIREFSDIYIIESIPLTS